MAASPVDSWTVAGTIRQAKRGTGRSSFLLAAGEERSPELKEDLASDEQADVEDPKKIERCPQPICVADQRKDEVE